MTAPRSAGRRVGVLMLGHLAVGLMAPYIVLLPALAAPFLENAANYEGRVRAAVLMMFAGSFMCMAISIVALPILRRRVPAAALALVALAVVAFALQGADSSAIMTILTVSQNLAQAAGGDTSQAAAAVVGPIRRWAHYSHLLVVGGWLLTLHGALLRTALAPRWLVAAGLVASVSQMTGVTLRALLGYSTIGTMAMPLAGTYAGLALWLIVKGFSEPPGPNHGDTHGSGSSRTEQAEPPD